MKKKDKNLEEHSEGKGKQSTPAPRAKYKIHIRSAEDIRRLLSSTINELRQDTIEASRASKIIYAASVLMGVIEQCDLEQRLAKLEDTVKKQY